MIRRPMGGLGLARIELSMAYGVRLFLCLQKLRLAEIVKGSFSFIFIKDRTYECFHYLHIIYLKKGRDSINLQASSLLEKVRTSFLSLQVEGVCTSSTEAYVSTLLQEGIRLYQPGVSGRASNSFVRGREVKKMAKAEIRGRLHTKRTSGKENQFLLV